MYIELHDQLLNHPKKIRLATILKIKPPHALGLIASLYLFTARYAEEDGNLTKFTAEEIAEGIFWHADAKTLIDAFVTAGFIEREGDNMRVHDWLKHGIRTLRQSRERTRKYREKNEAKPGSAAFHAAQSSLQ